MQVTQDDKSVNKKFDALLKKATAPRVKDKNPKKRRRGRPDHGRIVFRQKCIDALPNIAHLSEVARCLGIKHGSLQQWIKEDHPLPFLEENGRKLFRKDVLVAWLKATKRLKEQV